MLRVRSLLLIPLLFVSILFQACAPQPVKRGPVADPQALAKAAEMQAAGDYRGAAELLLRLAQDEAPPFRQDLQMQAVASLTRAPDALAALSLLEQVDVTGLPAQYALQRRVLRAEIYLLRDQPFEAIELLLQPPPADTSDKFMVTFYETKARALRQAGRPLDSALVLSRLDALITDPAQRLDVQIAILSDLTLLPDVDADSLQIAADDPFRGWLALAQIVGDPGSAPAQQQSDLAAWHARFPDHPALEQLVTEYQIRLAKQYFQPQQIAVLLPQSGRYAGVAGALRDGILAAYFDQPIERRSNLRFYDSSVPENAWPLYMRAISEGADMVIGPLDKTAVSQLALAGELEVPVLALNQAPPDVQLAANFFQFALAPEDEAEQAAEYARRLGFTYALTLTPKGSWGDRIRDSFRSRWEVLGGQIAEAQSYDPSASDFSATLQQLLDLDAGAERQKELQRVLGRTVEFEPRLRDDADFVFLAARSQKAREIRPQLLFHRAHSLPVIATSHVYSGIPDPQRDRDLEGIQFVEMPWLFEQGPAGLSPEQFLAALPQAENGYLRYYAMGMDGYNLVRYLPRLRAAPGQSVQGRSGTLRLDPRNQVRRQLLWVQMSNGQPVPIGVLPGDPNGPADRSANPLPDDGRTAIGREAR